MNFHPDLFLTPMKGPLVGLFDVPEVSTGQQMLSDDGNTSFDFPLMPRRCNPGRINDEPVMPLHLRISPVQGRIVKISLEHSRLEIIDHYRSRNPSKELKGSSMAIDPIPHILTKDKTDKPMPAIGS
jgi:hypothetical protein